MASKLEKKTPEGLKEKRRGDHPTSIIPILLLFNLNAELEKVDQGRRRIQDYRIELAKLSEDLLVDGRRREVGQVANVEVRSVLEQDAKVIDTADKSVFVKDPVEVGVRVGGHLLEELLD